MKTKRNLAILTFALILAESVHAQETEEYITKEFSISYPATWRLDTTKQIFSAIMFFSPLDGPEDKFDENLNLMTQDLRGQKIDVEAYKRITESQISGVKTTLKTNLILSAIEKDADGERYAVEYFMTMNGNDLHIKSVCKIKNEMAYLATFTTTVASFQRYSAVGLQMLESFKLK